MYANSFSYNPMKALVFFHQKGLLLALERSDTFFIWTTFVTLNTNPQGQLMNQKVITGKSSWIKKSRLEKATGRRLQH